MSSKLSDEEIANFWKTVDIDYNDLNTLPEHPGEPWIDPKTLPYFFESTVFKPYATEKSAFRFIRKFYLYYHFSDEIKEKTKNYSILLLEQQYAGIYINDSECIRFASLQPGKPVPHIIPITPKIYYESR